MHHQEGGVGSLLMPPQESEWTHQGPYGQQGKNLMGYEKLKKSFLKPRDADLWIKIWEALHELVKEACWTKDLWQKQELKL